MTNQVFLLSNNKIGLKAQHLTGIQLVRDLVNAKLVGGALNSPSITFVPGPWAQKSNFIADTKTAGYLNYSIL